LANSVHLPREAYRGTGLSELFNRPLVIFAVTLIAMGVSVHAGAFFARMARPVQDHDKKEDMALISNASLCCWPSSSDSRDCCRVTESK
jgi:hypothetical protein